MNKEYDIVIERSQWKMYSIRAKNEKEAENEALKLGEKDQDWANEDDHEFAIEKESKTFGYCDNIDCQSKSKTEFKEVKMRDEFGGRVVDWCEDCIERDKNMIERS